MTWRKIFFPDFYKGEADYVIAQQEDLLIYAGKKEIPVINVIFDKDEWGSLERSPILKELRGQRYKNFYKTSQSAFEKEGTFGQVNEKEFLGKISEGRLSNLLEKGQNIFITGCYDAICVKETVVGGIENGFKVHVDRDMNIMQDKRVDMYGRVSPEEYEADTDEEWSELKSKYSQFEDRLHVLEKTKQKAPLCK